MHGGVHRQVPRRQSFGTSVPPRTPATRRVQPRLVVGDQRVAVQGVLHQPGDRVGVVADLISLWILRTLVNPAIASAGRVALTAVLQYGVDHGANIREHKDLALGWESGIGTTGQYPRQDLIPGNMDDGFHHRDDETVLGVRATRVSGWEAK